MVDLMLIIRKSIETGKKIYCNGLGHFGAYHYLATKFDKYQRIASTPPQDDKPLDYQYDAPSGDLYFKEKKVCNSGVQVSGGNRCFADRSGHALQKGVLLPTKFDYMVFDSKNG